MQDTQVGVKSKHLEQFQERLYQQVPLVFKNSLLQMSQAVKLTSSTNLKHLMIYIKKNLACFIISKSS